MLKILAIFCAIFVIAGCGNESSMEPNEDPMEPVIANLIETYPAEGALINWNHPLTLTFDNPPLVVKVNGTAASIYGSTAYWSRPPGIDKLGDSPHRIEWINLDGSRGAGTVITLKVALVSPEPPGFTEGSVFDGYIEVEPEPLNRDGITYSFNEPITGGVLDIRTENGESLNWGAEWGPSRLTVTLTPGAKGKSLEYGTVYTIDVDVADRAGQCLRTLLTFHTKDKL